MDRTDTVSGERKFVVPSLLALAVLSIIWIIAQSVRNVANTGSMFATAGMVVLALLMLVLGGGLILKKPWCLLPLSLLGKLYLFFLTFIFLIRSQELLSTIWLLTAQAILYLGILNYLNPLRAYTGLEPVTLPFVAGRFVSALLLFATCATLYSVYIGNLFPEYAYRIKSQDYVRFVDTSTGGEDHAHTWFERWRVVVPEYLTPLSRNIGIGIWSNPQGEKLIVSERVWTANASEYTFLGFEDPYSLEKAVWTAGISKPFLLPIKMTMANEGTHVYHLENPGVNAIVIMKQVQTESGLSWLVSANVHPGSTPYNIESYGLSLERAFFPVKMTIQRYWK